MITDANIDFRTQCLGLFIALAVLILAGCGRHPSTITLPRDPEKTPAFELLDWTIDAKPATEATRSFKSGQTVTMIITVSGDRDNYFDFARQTGPERAANNKKPVLQAIIELTPLDQHGKPTTAPVFWRGADLNWSVRDKNHGDRKFVGKLPDQPGEYAVTLSFTHSWLMTDPGRAPRTPPKVVRTAKLIIE